VERGTVTTTTTNDAGIYVFPSVQPGQYQISVHKQGFKQVDLLGLIVNVQDHIEQNFHLDVGSVSESVTVEAGAPLINTESASVSTVVDRQFAENLPMNGRSFQTLIQLTPGVVLTPTSSTDLGQFSVNGQRASANYFMVDGVSANIGVLPSAGLSQTAGGSAVGFSVLGGTNNLVSEDALQEFRIQTSTYAPEFGRTPGAQISILTRSGANAFHSSLFEYLRNDIFDANDWFSNQKGLPKSPERINDFGGVLGGPIVKNRTFFFFSYEGQRLRLPQTGITTVPDLTARQSAPAAIQPFLNAYPLPNGPEILDKNGKPTSEQAQFNKGYSDEATLNATSIRVDHTFNNRLTLFGRYNYAPSSEVVRGLSGLGSLNSLTSVHLDTQTFTLGATWSLTSSVNDEFRFNYSRTTGKNSNSLDTLGGAVVPPDSILFPSPFTSKDSTFSLDIFAIQQGTWALGKNADNTQRQFNIVDGLMVQKGTHALKFGCDYRRLSPIFGPLAYTLAPFFFDVPSVVSGNAFFAYVAASRNTTVLFKNLGIFAQDTWRATPRLSLSYGLRWDTDFAPSTLGGPSLLAVTGFSNPAGLALAPSGTPMFKTTYNNFAPRVGVAYQVRNASGSESVLRGGFGLFYDLATQQVGDGLFLGSFPFGATKLAFFPAFPLNSDVTSPPAITVASLQGPGGKLVAFDLNLKLPYSYQWNVSVDQSLGKNQALSASYIGAIGRRLIQTSGVRQPNANFFLAELVGNFSTSDYHSLQLQFRRRLSQGLQALASYTWSHSIDTASSSSFASSDTFVGSLGSNPNRGPSDFDVRNSFTAGVTYNIPTPRLDRVTRAILGSWSLDQIIQARSAVPVSVFDSNLTLLNTTALARPDLKPGQPLYLYGTQCVVLSGGQCPGGKGLNPSAFTDPPKDPTTGAALRQGTLGRNALRGFGATQWDFAVRRQFSLRESLRLQFRAEFFNLLNHPNFGNPVSDLSKTLFGQSTAMLGRSLGGQNVSSGGVNPIFQIGGPRSIQFALKLMF
jgi:hypothetical protein